MIISQLQLGLPVVKQDWFQVSHSIRHAQKTHMSSMIDRVLYSFRHAQKTCKREVWSARKSCASSYSSILSALQTYLTCVFSVRVEKSTRATTRICTKKPFIEIECKILTTHKKISKRPYWLVKNMPHFILWFERELWMKSSKFSGKMEKIEAKWTQVSLKMSKTRSYQKVKGQCR